MRNALLSTVVLLGLCEPSMADQPRMTREQWCVYAISVITDPQIQEWGDPILRQALFEKVRASGCLRYDLSQ